MLSSPSTYWSEIKQGARDEEICIFKRKRERETTTTTKSLHLCPSPSRVQIQAGDRLIMGTSLPPSAAARGPAAGARGGSSTDGRGRAHVVRGTGASFIYVMTGMAVVRPWRPVPSSSGAMQAAHQFVSAIPHPRRTPTPRTPGAACCPTSIQLSAR